MPRRPTPADKLRDEILALRDDPGSDAARRTLEKGLASASGLVVEAAARVVGEAELQELAPLLAPAFARFLEGDVVKRDPGCRAKIEVARALCKLRWLADDTFRAGIRHRQLEPQWGPPVDTAAALRGHCAVGLALSGDPAAAADVAELLADPEWVARAAAAQALAGIQRSAAEPLLRFKIRIGDAEPAVIGDCFRSLLAIDPGAGPLVAAQLDADREEIAEQAAVALGESRLPEAFAWLREVAENALGSRRRVALLAIAMLRSGESRDYLVGCVADGDRTTALHALEALAIYRHDDALRARVHEAARRRGEAAVIAAARERLD